MLPRAQTLMKKLDGIQRSPGPLTLALSRQERWRKEGR